MGGKSFTRRSAVAAAGVGIIVGGLSTSAYAGPEEPAPSAAACDSKQLTMLFWPEGHPEIPGFGPEFLLAHVEVYTTTALAQGDFAAYVGADGSNNFAPPAGDVPPPCAPDKAVAPQKPKSARTEREAAAIVCSFDKAASIQIEPGGGTVAPRVTLLQSRKVVGAAATVSETGARVVYNKRLCKVRPAPPEGP